jgi:hypothetical protein
MEYQPPAPALDHLNDLNDSGLVGRLPFPLYALGNFQEPVEALHQECQAAIEICFASAFMVLNHAAQALVNVKIEKRTSPLSCFFLTVAESGERKTSVENITLQVTHEYYEKLEEKYKQDCNRYKKELFFYEATLKKIMASKEPIETQKQKIQDLEEPTKPQNPIMVTSNPTMQGLTRGFEEAFPSILLTSSEGGKFIGGYAMRQENQLNTLTTLSSLWDGSPIDQMKKEGRLYMLRGRRLALHLSVQPSVFDSFVRGRFVKDQGFLSRCLISVSKSLIDQRGTTLDIVSTAESKFTLLAYDKIMSLYKKIQVSDDTMSLKTLTVEQEGLQTLKAFYFYGHKRCGQDGIFYDIRAFVSKSVDHVLRIAATLMMYDAPDRETIPAPYIRSAIEIVRFYMSEHLSLFTQKMTLQDQNAGKLLAWFLKRFTPNDEVDRVHLLRSGPPKFRNKAALDPLLDQLEDRGLIQKASPNKWRLSQQAKVWQDPEPIEFPAFTGEETTDFKP